MLNINKINRNKIKLTYNTSNGVKTEKKNIKPLKIQRVKKGDYSTLNNIKYNINPGVNNYAFHCLNNNSTFLNTILQMREDFIKNLETPSIVFYDIETNEYSIPSENNEISKNARINSIAWIDNSNNEEYCLVKGIDGTEKEIIETFAKYCIDHNIMSLIGHNNFKFDNKVMITRMKALKIQEGINIFDNDCNLDTMVLASFLQYSNNKWINLNDLAELLGINDYKTDTGIHNPVTLYNKALQDNDDKQLQLFKEYNIQDVRLTKKCFESMNALPQLKELFKETLCPFNKMHYNQELLNSYTCKEALENHIVIPKSLNTRISFKNEGGLNLYEESTQLDIYENVVCFDIVSYYPHLLMLIGADPTEKYENINRETGEIKPFSKIPDGFLSKLSKKLYESRAKVKSSIEKTKDKEKLEKLNHEEKSKKIIVNSLYGVLSQKKGNYILKNELIGATITKLGRDLLYNIFKEFNGIYAKTDSIFIQLKNNQTPEDLLSKLNNYINTFFNKKYNLNNIKEDGTQLIRFKIDSLLKKIIIKSKNEYVKITDNKYIMKGSTFKSSTLSPFENDLNKIVIDNLVTNNTKTDDILNIVETFVKNTLKKDKPLNYYSKLEKLSSKTKKHKIQNGLKYMDNNNIPYTFNYRYLYCRVQSDKYDYITYPKHYNPENLQINTNYVYDLMIKQLKKLKIINNEKENELKKKYNTIQKNTSKKPQNSCKKVLFNTTKNKKLIELNKLIPDTSTYYNKGLLGFIPVKPNTKIGYLKNFNIKSEEEVANLPIDKFNENDNIGIVRGFKGLCILDIDGAKNILKPEDNQKLKDYLLQILKSIDYPFICQKTQSGGYHLLYYSNNKNNFNLKHIKYPSNFFIKELRGKSLGTGTIEIFQKQNGYCLFSPSNIINKNNNKKSYKLQSKNYTWKQIFNNEITNIQDKINKAFKNHDFIVKIEEPTKIQLQNINEDIINTSVNINKINKEGIKLMAYEIANIIEKTKGEHNFVILALEGGLDYLGINENNRREILFKALDIANDNDHKTQVEHSINLNRKDKIGFGENGLGKYETLKEHITRITNIKKLFWPNIENYKLQILKLAYTDLMQFLSTLIDKINTNDSKKFNCVKYINGFFKTIGVAPYERFELYKIGNELLINNKEDEIKKFIESEINGNCTQFYGLDGTNLRDGFVDRLASNFKKTKEYSYEIEKRIEQLQTLISVLGIINSEAIVNLYRQPKGLKAQKRRQLATNYLKNNYGFCLTKNSRYIWNTETNTYESISVSGLGNMIAREFGITGIEEKELSSIYKSSDRYIKEQNHLYRFNDGFLNVNNWEFEETDKLYTQFTTRVSKFKFNNFSILNDKKMQNNLIETTLKKIFIPKNNQDYTKLLEDFYERLGSCYNSRNIYKKLTLYFGLGNNGKGIIIEILKAIFGERCAVIDLEEVLNDKFTDLNNTDIWIIDEMDTNTFEGLIDKIKKITGGSEKGNKKRKIYTSESIDEKYPSMIFGFTNIIPDIPANQLAFFERVDVLKLPNTFKNNPSDEVNEYKMDRQLQNKINNNYENLQWLVSKATKTYLDRITESNIDFEFTCHQSAEETKMIINQNDPMKTFLINNYKVDKTKTSRISNKSICAEYKNWCKDRNIQFNQKNLSGDIGKSIINVFGEIKFRSNGVNYYLVPKRYKSNVSYIIQEYDIHIVEYLDNLEGPTLKIYNKIKQREQENNPISHEELDKLFSKESNINKEIKELINNGFIQEITI